MAKLKLKVLTFILFWWDVIFTVIDNKQLIYWNKLIVKREEVEYEIDIAERASEGSVDSWDDLT